MVNQNELINGRYQLDRILGCGGMGDVFLGADTITGEKVAIKRMRVGVAGDMPQMAERFLREGSALRRLNHPNIVKVLSTVDDESQHFIIMEYVSGGSLADLIKDNSSGLPIEKVVSIALELSDALSRAHHLNILHRDIKPANILLAEDGTPRLTDFGLARIGNLSEMTESNSILGTFSYLSPEVIENTGVDERSDIWSFGVVLYEMLTGRLPFGGETPFEIIWAIKNQPLPILENLRGDIPVALANLVRKMLRKDNPARIDSVRKVGAELEVIQRELLADKKVSEQSDGDLSAGVEAARIIRVVIADDHAVVRQGLRMFIDLQDDMQVVGEGTNGFEAVNLVEQYHPDVVLIDLVMPEMNGVEATRKIKMISPATHVLILTSFSEDNQIVLAIQAGALGYLLKDIRPDELVQAVRDADNGQTRMQPDIARKLLTIVAAK